MRRVSYIRVSAVVCGALGLAGLAGDHRVSAQTVQSGASQLEIGAVRHETRSESETALEFPNTNEFPSESETVPPPPTRSSFMATWPSVTGAKGYLLDVSTSSSFDSFVDGYHDLDVGDATGRVVTGLSRGTTYYYRVRAYDATAAIGYSGTAAMTTEPTTGLTIHPTFDSSITGKPNAAAIQAMIHRAIAIYESLFSDPITIQIRFRYATTAPDGSPLPQGLVSESDTVLYTNISWNSYVSALRADARTTNDNIANASLPGSALSAHITPGSANGRAVGLNTPPAMFANGTVGPGGPYDGIVTLNSSRPFQFSRPVNANNFDAQRLTEHEIDEVIGLGSRLGHNDNDLLPQDLFSWSSAGHRNITSSGTRYFSINGGVTNIVGFNQRPDGDFSDWLSTACPQAHPYPQNAFSCPGQSSDIGATSPEGINLDVIGYDLSAAASSPENDFNNDGHPDYLLYSGVTRRTVVWYMNNNVHFASDNGPILPSGWSLVTVADFNNDGHPDYLLFNPATRATVIWYLVGSTFLGANHGPQLVSGWQVVGTGDFNGNGGPDLVLYRASTHETVIWYLNNNVRVGSARGPTIPGGWNVVAVADFNGDGNPDYLLFRPATGQSVIWYLSGVTRSSSRSGPAVSAGYDLVGVADFDGNGTPDYVLYNPSTRQTGIWYLLNNLLIGTAFGPTLPGGWLLVAP
jgi:FG-GAP-like repeat